jgi:epoxyqueuosine reductase
MSDAGARGAGPAESATARGRLEREAARLGFLRLGIAAAGTAATFERFAAWIEAGFHGSMEWLESGAEDRRDIRRFLPEAKSVVVVSARHAAEEPLCTDADDRGPVGIVARYARSRDYHKALRRHLVSLARISDRLLPGSRSRIFLDTAPVLEREWGARAGLGWIGKNGCLIDPQHGSWLLLGGFATTAAIDGDAAPVAEGCGACRRCLDACPTGAFLGPRELDARRCLSYTTIEHRGPLGERRLSEIGDRIFGCDICQEVCPWNAGADDRVHPALAPRPALARWPLDRAGALDRTSFDREFAGTAVRRPGFVGFARSVAAALAAVGKEAERPLLDRLEEAAGKDPGAREAIEFARRKIGGTASSGAENE